MAEKKVLQKALQQLENGEAYELASAQGSAWRLSVGGVEIAVITDEQKNWILGPAVGYQAAGDEAKAAMMAQVGSNVASTIRALLITPSMPTNLDASCAELIMGWTRQADQPNCRCLTYRTANGETRFVAQRPESGCTGHDIWSPSLNLSSTQDLYEKPFLCADGRFLAIQNVNTAFQAKAPNPGEPVVITNKDLHNCRTVITFRNAARTETFEVVDERLIPPAAVCVACLRLIGVNVQIN